MRSPLLSCLIVGCLCLGVGKAQTPVPAAPPQPPAPVAAAPTPPPAAPPAAKPTDKLPIRERERTVYVPYEELEKVFQDGGRGVFLPYREFLELWNELTLKRDDDEKPPANGAVTRAEYAGRVDGTSLVLNGKLTVESFRKGWIELPLGGSDMTAIGEAQTGKAVLESHKDGYRLLLPEKGVYEVSLKLFAPVTETNGRQRAKLALPRAAVSKVTAVVPGEALEFEVTPAAAFTSRSVGGGMTELAFFIGGGAMHEVSWGAPRAVTQLSPLLLADTRIEAAIGSGSIATTAAISYRIMRAPVSSFRISIPDGHEVLGVTGDDIKEWTAAAGPANRKTIVISPNKPVKDKFALSLSLEAPIAKLPAEVLVPDIIVEGASYARGTAIVQAESQFDAAAKTLDGVMRANAVGTAPADGKMLVGHFRLLKQPWRLSLDVTEAKPQIEVASVTKLQVQRDALTVAAAFDFTVRRVGIFEVVIAIPAGLIVSSVTGDGISEWNVTSPAAGAAGASQTLLVKLPQQKTGVFSIHVAARQLRTQPADDLTIPVFVVQNAGRHEAKVGVAVHSSLEANTKGIGDFQQEDVSALAADLKAGAKTRPSPAEEEMTLAFRYRDAAKPAVLSFKSRASQVSAEVLTLVEAREQSTRHTWTLSFDVAYAAVDRFILAVPKAIAGEVRLVDPLIKEIKKDHQPDAQKIPNADTASTAYWEVILRSEKMDAFQVTLSHEKLGALESGRTGKIELLQAHVPGAFQETGQVAVIKDDTLEIRGSQPENLEEIDARELHPAIQRPGVFLAFKYRSLPIKLAVDIAKNDFFSVPQAVVTHADLTTAVATDRAQSTEVIYWVKNIDLQFLVVTLPPGAKLVSDIIVNRETRQPMKREGSDDLLVRLPSGAGASREAFPVRFVYQTDSPNPGVKLPAMGSLDVDAPSLGEVKVFETRHRLFLPKSFHYVEFTGPLTQSIEDRGWVSRRLRRITDVLLPAFGPQIRHTGTHEWSDPPVVAAEIKSLYDFPVPEQDHIETLRRLGPPAKIGVRFRSEKITLAFEAAAFLITLLIGVLCCRCSVTSKLVFVVFFGFGPVLATGLLAPANVPVALAMILAAAAAVGIWMVLGVFGVFGAIFRRRRGPSSSATRSPPPSMPSTGAVTAPSPPPVAPAPATEAAAAAKPSVQPAASAAPLSGLPAPLSPPDVLEFPAVEDQSGGEGKKSAD